MMTRLFYYNVFPVLFYLRFGVHNHEENLSLSLWENDASLLVVEPVGYVLVLYPRIWKDRLKSTDVLLSCIFRILYFSC